MGLTYFAKRAKRTDPDNQALNFSPNVDGCTKLALIHRHAGLPLNLEAFPGVPNNRVPYKATAGQCRAWHAVLTTAKPPKGLGWLQTAWRNFLSHAAAHGGYDTY